MNGWVYARVYRLLKLEDVLKEHIGYLSFIPRVPCPRGRCRERKLLINKAQIQRVLRNKYTNLIGVIIVDYHQWMRVCEPSEAPLTRA